MNDLTAGTKHSFNNKHTKLIVGVLLCVCVCVCVVCVCVCGVCVCVV